MWRDDRIQAAIDTTTGFIAAKLAEKLECPIHEAERLFLASKTYRLLCDPETGLYADNVLMTADLFLHEVAPVLYPQEKLTPQSYFKYRSLSDPHTETIFKKKELWYAAPQDFNDPFDCNLQLNCDGSTDKEIEESCIAIAEMAEQGRTLSPDDLRGAVNIAENGSIQQLFDKWQKDRYAGSSVCCFSCIGDSIPMFACYADGHTGICIEFSFSVLDMPTGISVAQQLFGSARIIPIQVVYQKEYRIFRDKIPAGPVPFAPKILKRVILGAKTGDKEMGLVKEWLREWPTPVILSKAEPDTQAFKLNICDIETVGGPQS